MLESRRQIQKDNSGVKFGESTKYFVWDQYKRDAAKRNYIWNLTKDEFFNLTSQNCFYCNLPPSNIKVSSYGKGDFVYSGIDRIDNSRGYDTDNAVPCCKTCNRAKDIMGQGEFLEWVSRVHNHRNL